ncbi:MAG: hypothetical protein QM790_01470 [Nibricoccus sp.]
MEKPFGSFVLFAAGVSLGSFLGFNIGGARKDAVRQQNRSVTARLSATTVNGASPSPALLKGSAGDLASALSAPMSQAADEAIIAAVERLASTDPEAARRAALQQPNLRLRWEMVRAVLRGWALGDPDAAAGWALSGQTYLEPNIAVEAVLEGLVPVDSARAIALVDRLSQDVAPALRVPFGTALIAQLSRFGAFAEATRFAAASNEPARDDWVAMSFNIWANHQPEAALQALGSLSDNALREKAWKAVVEGWAVSDPRALAENSLQSSDPAARDFGLSEALSNWAYADPQEAAAWVVRVEATTNIDSGLAAVAKSPAFTKKPATGLALARLITQPTLRSTTIGDIVREWAGTDVKSAIAYASETPDLTSDERDSLVSSLRGAYQ